VLPIELFASIAARPPASHAGWRAEEPVTYGAFVQRVRAWTALGRREPARDIALHHNDSLEFAAALLGAWQAGKTVWLAANTLPATCALLLAQPCVFWGDYPDIWQPHVPTPDAQCPLPWQEPDANFPALVVHTSGSTGAPRAIPKQMAQLTSELTALETQFGAQLGGAEIVASVSHQHIYGLLFRVLWPLQAGRAIHASSHDHPERLVRALALRPSILVASPAYLKRLPAYLDWSGAAGKLRAVFSSGGVLAPEAATCVRNLLQQAPVEVYGSSETGGIAWRQESAVWRPLPNVAWRIEDGNLAVLSPHAGPDWVVLADMARADADGFVLLGRSDRIVKIEEKRISLDALEDALRGSGLARDARVLPLPGTPGQRQALAAFVVPTAAGQAVLMSGKAAMHARLRAVLAGVVEAVALPRRWCYLDQLPVDAQGKTTQGQLLALLDDADTAVDVVPRP
jgi:acyl-coenzyme A synthetase/AMP-(fatty) acid ligase